MVKNTTACFPILNNAGVILPTKSPNYRLPYFASGGVEETITSLMTALKSAGERLCKEVWIMSFRFQTIYPILTPALEDGFSARVQ